MYGLKVFKNKFGHKMYTQIEVNNSNIQPFLSLIHILTFHLLVCDKECTIFCNKIKKNVFGTMHICCLHTVLRNICNNESSVHTSFFSIFFSVVKNVNDWKCLRENLKKRFKYV